MFIQIISYEVTENMQFCKKYKVMLNHEGLGKDEILLEILKRQNQNNWHNFSVWEMYDQSFTRALTKIIKNPVRSILNRYIKCTFFACDCYNKCSILNAFILLSFTRINSFKISLQMALFFSIYKVKFTFYCIAVISLNFTIASLLKYYQHILSLNVFSRLTFITFLCI